MATTIDMSTVGTNSGTPLTPAAITVGGGAEEALTFTNHPPGGVTLVITTALTDLTYGLATGETGGHVLANSANLLSVSTGKGIFFNSATGGDIYIRIF